MRQSVLTRATYSLVNSAQDAQPSILDDDALHSGIHFKAKFIGSMEVPRPTNRVEIVAAMRTIRYEYKEKGMKKTKIDLCISTTGVSIERRSKAKLWKKWMSVDDNGKQLMQHPVYRIFYVSHDSQDLQIFSYIACDTASIFKCHVFKASTKSGAIHIVRTIGRVFDLCHRLNQQPVANAEAAGKGDAVETAAAETQPGTEIQSSDVYAELAYASEKKADVDESISKERHIASPCVEALMHVDNSSTRDKHVELVLRQQLRLEQLRSQQLTAEVELAQNQLKAETAARIDLQLRVQQLLQQNQRLLNYVGELVYGIKRLGNSETSDYLIDFGSSPKKDSSFPIAALSNLSSPNYVENDSSVLSAISPDSGHREMSSDGGVSLNTNPPSDMSWYSALAAGTVTASGYDDTRNIPRSFASGILSSDPDFRQQNPAALLGGGVQSCPTDSLENRFIKPSPMQTAAAKPAQSESGTDLTSKQSTLNETGSSLCRGRYSFTGVIGENYLLDFDTLCVSSASNRQDAAFTATSSADVKLSEAKE